MPLITFAILTVSDTCYAKTAVDTSGPALAKCVETDFAQGCVLDQSIVPDEIPAIKEYLCLWSSKACDVILTTGGTGFSCRDVTPEATKAVIDKEAPGLSYAMISKSLQVTDMAALSRAACGIKNNTIIVNLPGSAKAATECFGFIKKAIPHAVDLLKDKRAQIRKVHRQQQEQSVDESRSKVKVDQVAFRNRHSAYPLIEMEEARRIILGACVPKKATVKETVDIRKCANRVLAQDVYSKDPIPPFHSSMKDGYAVRSADGAGVRIVRDVVAAGDSALHTPLQPGEVIRISTGASVPEGADAVVQVEDTLLVESSSDGSKELKVTVTVEPKSGQDICPKGSNIPSDTLVLKAGDLLTAAHVGVLATVGKTRVCVHARPRVGVLSTGNELQQYNEELLPGHIRDSNKLTLLSLLESYGYTATDCGIAKDNPDSIKACLASSLARHDALITTGGVSMGEYDLVKQVLLQDFGATVHFGRINLKPGKPTTFVTCVLGGVTKFVFCLPGNPVSAMVTCVLLVVPAFKAMESRSDYEKSTVKVPVLLGEDIKLDTRPEYARAHVSLSLEGTMVAHLTGDQVSSRINSFIGANALLLLPPSPEKSVCKKGQILEAILI